MAWSADRYDDDVQNLLCDIESNNGEGPQRTGFSYSRPVNRRLSSRFFNSGRSPSQFLEQNYLPHEPQQNCSQQVLDFSPSDQYNQQCSDTLDNYDRAFLAEPQSRLQWREDNSSGTIAPGRLSLPGHTAPYTPRPVSEQVTNQQRPKLNQPPCGVFRAKLSQFMRTPPNQSTADSSPTVALTSSPLFDVSQRRPTRHRSPPRLTIDRSAQSTKSWPTTSSNTKKTRTSGLPRKELDDRVIERNILPAATSPLTNPPMPIQSQMNLGQSLPIVQGIQLVSTNNLPDRLRPIFPFNPFNAIQSKCYSTAYETGENLVLSAPTGGGKTAIFELAICRLVSIHKNDQYKIVYMAPTKSLCAERQRDWQAKFAVLDLVCAELTGDTDFAHLRRVQSASIVITTPEKWDSMTRQWKDHARLMQLVKLFLIDEVHMLKGNRGATLEAVVSRMKSVGSGVRFLALSATVPNSEDVATWLGRDHANQHLPAVREVFGEEFRPVKLQKHIVGLPYKGNDFGFEGVCNPKLPDIIAKYGSGKPLMVFCITRKAAQMTAKFLANIWASKDPRDRQWQGPAVRIAVNDPELMNALPSAVAFHHAGLETSDRLAVEQGFLTGQISVICCTSTLAVGVNLPCHLVIIKNTVTYQNDSLKEYAELEIMQMLGRAGRPQFDDSAAAVIITRQEKVKKYEQLITGSELLESCLHLNLIDHLNAEIGLGTIYDLQTAKRWLGGTFLYVRLRKNPEHYKLDEDMSQGDLDQSIEKICQRDLELLKSANLVTVDRVIRATELGHIMARYYVQFKTMDMLLSLGPRSKISDILSSLVQAEEYREVRLRAFEKKLFKEINNSDGIKFPIKVDLAMHAHKRSLLVQSELGGVEFPTDEQYAKHKRTFQTEKSILFSNAHRLIRCVVDINVHLQDAINARHALELARSLSAGVWDNSPFQMKQISQIGPVAIRKFALNGINSIEALEAAEPHRIELLLSKNPPFGSRLISKLRDFPKLRVSIKRMDKELKAGHPVCVKLKLECGFINDKVPIYFNRKPIYVCLLTERSDGHLIDFRRISATKLNSGQDVLVSADITDHTQHVICHVMCEEIAGTMRHAQLRLDLPVHLFPTTLTQPQRRQQQGTDPKSRVTSIDDEFGDDDIKDQDIIDAGQLMPFDSPHFEGRSENLPVEGQDFEDIENFASGKFAQTTKERSVKSQSEIRKTWNPEALDNGKWACNHKCKDKTSCKHLCCREGLDKAPKPPRTSSTMKDMSTIQTKQSTTGSRLGSSKTGKLLESRFGKAIEKIDLAREVDLPGPAKETPRHMQDLEKLHQSINKAAPKLVVHEKRLAHKFDKEGQLRSLNDDVATSSPQRQHTNYSDESLDFLPSPSKLLEKQNQIHEEEEMALGLEDRPADDKDVAERMTTDSDSLEDFDLSQFDNDNCDIEAAMIGLSDSISIQRLSNSESKGMGTGQCQQNDSSKAPLSISSLTPNLEFINSVSVVRLSEMICLDDNSSIALPIVPEKRHAEDFPESVAGGHNPIESKRQKCDSTLVEPPSRALTHIGPPQQEEEEEVSPGPVIKPGQPAWVYDFDPAFIAEYQDFVEFV